MQNWSKKVHVESSLKPRPNQWSLFIGRWQPLHDGHKALFDRALTEGKNVWIAIRDVQITDSNPFDPQEVRRNIESHYSQLISESRVMVSIIPDICSVEFGRGVGYDIIEHIPPTEVAEISATKIREQMKENGQL